MVISYSVDGVVVFSGCHSDHRASLSVIVAFVYSGLRGIVCMDLYLLLRYNVDRFVSVGYNVCLRPIV